MRGRAIVVMWVVVGCATSCIPRPDDSKKTAQPVAQPVAAPPPPPPAPTRAERRAGGMAAFQGKDYPRAKVELYAVVAEDPNDGEVHFVLGMIFEAEGDKKTATHAFFTAAKLDAGKTEPVALRPMAGLLAEGRHDDMLVVLVPARANNPKSFPIAQWLARAQTGKQDHAGAVETWSALAKERPEEPTLHAQLSLSLQAAGKTADAKKEANVALAKWQAAKKPNAKVELGAGPDELALVARAFRRAGAPLDAITALSLSTKDTGLTHTERGFARRAVKDAVAAQSQAKKALEVGGPELAPAHLLIAAIAADANDADRATGELAEYRKLTAGDTTYDAEEKLVAAALASKQGAPKEGAPKEGAPKEGAPKEGAPQK